MSDKPKIVNLPGMTGIWPEGHKPQGDTNVMAMGVMDDQVVIDFQEPVKTICLTGDDAMYLASVLIKHAVEAGLSAPLVMRMREDGVFGPMPAPGMEH